jgi:hypothetical protein
MEHQFLHFCVKYSSYSPHHYILNTFHHAEVLTAVAMKNTVP